MYFVYMLRCVDGTLYTGITTDLERRVAEHNRGVGSKYTRARLPVKVAYFEKAQDKSRASKREYAIKKLGKLHKEKLVEQSLAGPGETGDGMELPEIAEAHLQSP